MSRLIIVLVIVLLVVAPAVPSAAQDALPELTLFLGFVPNIQFAPIYMAIERGYFAEAGVNVVIEYGDENVGVERIAAGELQFGVISGEQVVLARAGGRPLVYVFEWYQRFPVAVIASVDSGIQTAADLAGHVVGVPGRFGASYMGLRALLAAVGLSEDDILLQEIGFAAPAALCAGQVEASVVYVANEPEQVREQCFDVNIIEVSSLADLVANGLVTNEATIADNPDLVRGMVSALSRGLADVIADPDAAIEASRAHVETLPARGGSRVDVSIAAADALRVLHTAQDSGEALTPEVTAGLIDILAGAVNPDEVVQMRVLRNSIPLWNAPHLGETDPASWETTMNALIEMGLLAGPVDLSGAYTNAFLP
jgi:NitT/TauT family transport system substrate-binding protein